MVPCSINRFNKPKKLEHIRHFRRNVMVFLKKIGMMFMLLLLFGSVLIR